jgi:RND superfamily putative drug exporter
VRPEVEVTVGELLRERLELTLPWYRSLFVGRELRRWLDAINTAAATAAGYPLVRVTAASTLDSLPQFERAVALAAVALCERSPIAMLDQLDAFQERDELAFLAAVDALAPARTTVVIGTPLLLRAASAVVNRPLIPLDLRSPSGTRTTNIDSEGALR